MQPCTVHEKSKKGHLPILAGEMLLPCHLNSRPWDGVLDTPANLHLLGRRVYPELDKDDTVLNHGAERTEQPRECPNKVVAFLRVDHDTGAIGEVARQGQQEEQKS